MELLVSIFGEGKELNTLNMCSRALVIFIVALVLIRISGRRSFGLGTPLDNIIVVLLGAVLSRTVTGASPVFPTIAASLTIVIMHRILSWALINHKGVRDRIQGDKILLGKDGKLIEKNLDRALVGEEDIKQELRHSMQTDDLDKTETIYMERNGKITAVKKED